MTRKLNLALLILTLFVGLPFVWLVLDSSVGSATARPISMMQLRRLAASVPGEPPFELRYELIGRRSVASDLLAAGSGLRPVPYGIRAYEAVYRNGRVVTIDRGMSREVAQQKRVSDFDPEAQAIVEHAVMTAWQRLTLSNDPRHSGQANVAYDFGSGRNVDRERDADVPYVVAPGVVVIPTDDVAPGKRMVYIRLASDDEVILAGDVAPVRSSWQELRPPARLHSIYYSTDDREATVGWLLALCKLKASAARLEIVPGHDSFVPRILIHGFTNDPGLRRIAREASGAAAYDAIKRRAMHR